jgi:hypothetical protein
MINEVAGLRDRVGVLERQLGRTRRVCAALVTTVATISCLAAVFVFSGFQQKQSSAQILRARGLVIVDDAGRDRILIGAPIPSSKNRVRTDLKRVEEIWGKHFPKKYMEYYQNYRHNVNGLVIMNDQGFDRLAIGDSVPDPNIGKRIGPEVGLLINDAEGWERGGYGLLRVGDAYRGVLGLDSNKEMEGLALVLDDKGGVGVMVRDKDQSLFLGSAPAGYSETGLAVPFHGLVLRKGKEVKHQINVADK